MRQFEKSLRQKRREVAAELPTGIDKPAQVGGGIVLCLLTKSNSFDKHVDAEIRARGIKMSKKQGESWSLAEKRGKIRQDEYNRRCNADPEFSRENNVKDISYVVPLSSELKSQEVFEKQQQILDKAAGILALDEWWTR